MSRAQIDILINARNEAGKVLRQAQQQYSKFDKSVQGALKGQGRMSAGLAKAGAAFSGLSNKVAKVGAKFFWISQAANMLKQAMDFGSVGAEMDAQMNLISSSTGEALIAVDRLSQATDRAYSTKTLLRFQAAQKEVGGDFGFTAEQLKKLSARFARLGMDANEGLGQVTDALVKTEGEILVSMGIMDRSEVLMRRYADTVGKSAEELSLLERRQAMLSDMKDRIDDITTSGLDNKAAFDKMANSLADIGNLFALIFAPLGRILEPVISKIRELSVMAAAVLLPAFDLVADAFEGITSLLGPLIPVFEAFKIAALLVGLALEKIGKVVRFAAKGLAALARPWKNMATSMNRWVFGASKAAKATKTAAQKFKDLKDTVSATARSFEKSAKAQGTMTRSLEQGFLAVREYNAESTAQIAIADRLVGRWDRYVDPASAFVETLGTSADASADFGNQFQRMMMHLSGLAENTPFKMFIDQSLGVQAWNDKAKALKNYTPNVDEMARTFRDAYDQGGPLLARVKELDVNLRTETDRIQASLIVWEKFTDLRKRMADEKKWKATATEAEVKQAASLLVWFEKQGVAIEDMEAIMKSTAQAQKNLKAGAMDFHAALTGMRNDEIKTLELAAVRQGQISDEAFGSLMLKKQQVIEEKHSVEMLEEQRKAEVELNKLRAIGLGFLAANMEVIFQAQDEATRARHKEEVLAIHKKLATWRDGLSKTGSARKSQHRERLKEIQEEQAAAVGQLQALAHEQIESRAHWAEESELVDRLTDAKKRLAAATERADAASRRGHDATQRKAEAEEARLEALVNILDRLIGRSTALNAVQAKLLATQRGHELIQAKMDAGLIAATPKRQEELEHNRAMAELQARRASIVEAGGKGTADAAHTTALLATEETRHAAALREIAQADLATEWQEANQAMQNSIGIMSQMSPVLGTVQGSVMELAKTWDLWAASDAGVAGALNATLGITSKAAASFIDDQRAKAGVMALFELAQGLATSVLAPHESISHYAAAAMFGVIAATGAGTGGGGGGGGGAAVETAAGPERGQGGGGGPSSVIVNLGSGIVLGTPVGIAGAIQDSLHEGAKAGVHSARS